MPPLSHTRHAGMNYHVAEAKSWLAAADGGSATTALAYAAFELRLGVERILFQYFFGADPERPSPDMLRMSAKQVENKIYEIGGHQRQIDARFRFVEIMFELLGEPQTLARPNLGKLSRYWHDCSELCHIAWTLGAPRLAPTERTSVFNTLSEIADELSEYVSRLVAWPRLGEPWVDELQEKFAHGEISEEAVRSKLQDLGVWARIVYPNGTSTFFGTAVPPGSTPRAV